MNGASNTLIVQIQIVDPTIVVPGSVVYNSNLVLTKSTGCTEEISFQYISTNGEIETYYRYFSVSPYEISLSVDNLVTCASSKGFNPSKGNYIWIYSNVAVSVPYNVNGTVDLRLRVYNSSGKYVYQKVLSDISGGGFFNLKWDGKASKNNEAGVKATYLKKGNYRVELALIYEGNGDSKVVSKRTSLKVSKSAPSGTKGVAKAKSVILYTGNANVDYMAELMVKAAGVKSGMSADQKVKKIYHYMTTKFKHIHYGESGRKTYYNLTKLKSKISKFKTASDKKTKQGKLLYSYNVGWNTEYCMSTRSGVCDNHAQIFKILCNHVGVEARVCGGYYKNRNGSLAGHSWNSAIVNGKTYYYDVDIEIQNYGGGQGDYYWYKKTLKQAKKNHVFY